MTKSMAQMEAEIRLHYANHMPELAKKIMEHDIKEGIKKSKKKKEAKKK